MDSEKIGERKVVTLHLTITTEDGKVVETTRGRGPAAYLHGFNNIVSGLEAALTGRSAGEHLSITLPPEQGYGLRKGKGAEVVPRREFPRHIDLREGLPLEIKDSAGNPVRVWVTKVQGSKVWIDVDHPLAGKTLRYDVDILDVRDADPEELSHGHAHIHGHH